MSPVTPLPVLLWQDKMSAVKRVYSSKMHNTVLKVVVLAWCHQIITLPPETQTLWVNRLAMELITSGKKPYFREVSCTLFYWSCSLYEGLRTWFILSNILVDQFSFKFCQYQVQAHRSSMHNPMDVCKDLNAHFPMNMRSWEKNMLAFGTTHSPCILSLAECHVIVLIRKIKFTFRKLCKLFFNTWQHLSPKVFFLLNNCLFLLQDSISL